MKKIDVSKILPIVVGALNIAVMVLSNVIDTNEKQAMKNELKEEILKDLNPNN